MTEAAQSVINPEAEEESGEEEEVEQKKDRQATRLRQPEHLFYSPGLAI